MSTCDGGPFTMAEKAANDFRHSTMVTRTLARANRALAKERNRGSIRQDELEKDVISPLDFLGKCIVRIDLRNLYRKYRGIDLSTAKAILGMVERAKHRDEAIDVIKGYILCLEKAMHKDKEECAES